MRPIVGAFRNLGARPLRTVLSCAAISVGIAALVAILGTAATAEQQTTTRLDALHQTLVATPIQTGNGPAPIPLYAAAMATEQPKVTAVAALASLPGQPTIQRTPFQDPTLTSSVQVQAATGNVPRSLGIQMQFGSWPDTRDPAGDLVVGAAAASFLGLDRTSLGTRLLIDGVPVTLAGVLEPSLTDPPIDDEALVGLAFAERLARITTLAKVYVRVQPDAIDQVGAALPHAIDPVAPGNVQLQLPDVAEAAAKAAQSSLNGLYLALAAVALAIGALGVVNTLTVAVIERRAEIGLRRALGANGWDIADQFVVEGALLGLLGGMGGLLVGAWVTLAVSWRAGAAPVLPLTTAVIGVGGAILLGVAAGLVASGRAATLPPSDALRLVP